MTEQSVKPHIHLDKKWLLGGGVVVAGVYYFYRKRASASTAASTASNSDTADESTIDPTTGIPFADENSVTSGSPYSALSGLTYDALTGQYEAVASTTTSTVPTDNASWAKDITNYLVGQGFDQTSVESALGSYLENNGQALTQGQLSIVQTALAYGGTPPVGVPTQLTATNTGQSSTYEAGNNDDILDTATGQVFQAQSGGLYWLNPAEYAEQGSPKTTGSFSDPSYANQGFIPNRTATSTKTT